MNLEQEFRNVCYKAIDADAAFVDFLYEWKRLSAEERAKYNHIMPFIVDMGHIYSKLGPMGNIDDLLTAFNAQTRPSQYSVGDKPIYGTTEARRADKYSVGDKPIYGTTEARRADKYSVGDKPIYGTTEARRADKYSTGTIPNKYTPSGLISKL
ncbi:hypothetical protein F-M6_0223 [Faustovirus]|nr:hypothetical protein F-M6_0223 [Faustovirus]